MSLQNIQAEFSEWIFSEEVSHINENMNDTKIIYRNNIFATLLNVLTDIYPMIKKIVGADFFYQTAKEYIRQYPSRSSNLHDYGEYFSDFINNYAPTKNLVYLPEVAIFEWHYHQLNFASNHTGFNINELMTISPNQYPHLRFMLHPASKLILFQYPILRIVDLCCGRLEENISLDEGEVYLLMLRQDTNITLESLSIPDFTFLSALRDNLSLSDALEMTLLVDSQFQLEKKILHWINNKVIVDCLRS